MWRAIVEVTDIVKFIKINRTNTALGHVKRMDEELLIINPDGNPEPGRMSDWSVSTE